MGDARFLCVCANTVKLLTTGVGDFLPTPTTPILNFITPIPTRNQAIPCLTTLTPKSSMSEKRFQFRLYPKTGDSKDSNSDSKILELLTT